MIATATECGPDLAPEQALEALAARLGRDRTVAAAQVASPQTPPALGVLAAGGPRAASDPGRYSLLTEAVYEGYLLHHSTSRLLRAADPDLALLAGDYLYALGIAWLAPLGDEAAVVELGDLISLAAQIHADGRSGAARSLWLASACAIGCGATPSTEAAKRALREGDPAAEALLREAAADLAERHGLSGLLAETTKAIEFRAPDSQG